MVKINSLYSFDNPYPKTPEAALIEYKGLLYGTTKYGGVRDQGTVFTYNPNEKHTEVVHSFQGEEDGAYPLATLIEYRDLLYGTTNGGGVGGRGTLFTYDPINKSTEVVHSFQGQDDGANPWAAVIEYKGLLYGTTLEGGVVGRGTLFRYNPNEKTTEVVHSFRGEEGGAYPYPALIEYKGLLYGTTIYGGVRGQGTLFTYNPNNNTTEVVHRFQGEDGANPLAALIEYKGLLYGTTRLGGEEGKGKVGTIFSVTLPVEKEVEKFVGNSIKIKLSLKVSVHTG